jgi:hypothetical protein
LVKFKFVRFQGCQSWLWQKNFEEKMKFSLANESEGSDDQL